MMGRFIGIFTAIVLYLAAPAAAKVRIFAAASLADGLQAALAGQDLPPVEYAFAGSSLLARQIEYGAPADIFISANQTWMDALAEQGLLAHGYRRDVLGNRLALISHALHAPVTVSSDLDLTGLLGNGRLAMGLVTAVPAGIYGRSALQSLGLWEHVKAQVAQTDNVRAALALVSSGAAPLGIVYATDARAANVTVLGLFPENSHPSITYPAAILRGRNRPEVLQVWQALTSAKASQAFAAQGFIPLAGQ
jgi:molybdate transport system substrate-binding protein